jgi:hypothetical protein
VFSDLVVSLFGVSRRTHEVSHWLIEDRIESGKSDPQSTIQPTDCDNGGGEKRRAPRAAYEPAPPIMSVKVGSSWPKEMSSERHECLLLRHQ